jgi:hypothetical protein
MIRRLAALLACIALGVGVAFAQTAPAQPPGTVTFTAQLLDLRGGYAYFTSGDAFKLSDAYRLTDYDTGAATTTIPSVKWFARATLDPASKEIIVLAVTKRRVPVTAMQQFHQFAIVASTPAPAPELKGPGLTGRPVSVVFEVTVPPTTQLTDNIYISTDAGGWNAQEIKLDRVNAYQYRASRTYASGTKFAWRVTRGTWNSVERGENNLDSDPHQFTVREVDALAARATVYHWSDDNPTQQGVGPNSIPTPFNANPFGGRNGVVVPQIPTSPPTPQR